MTDHDALLEESFHLLGRTLARFDPGRLEAWVELGLTMTQLRVLFILRNEGGASARTLADRLNVTPSTLTRIVDRLVGQGLVCRSVDEDDRRLVRHSLTEAGASAVEELERAGRSRMNEVFGRLSGEELGRLVSALRDLAAAMDAVEADERVGV